MKRMRTIIPACALVLLSYTASFASTPNRPNPFQRPTPVAETAKSVFTSVVYHPGKDKLSVQNPIYHPRKDHLQIVNPIYHPKTDHIRIDHLTF